MKRKDAIKVKDIDGLHNILIDLKPKRCDSDVYINQKIDEWIKEISPFIKNLKLGEEKEKTNKNIFHMLQISEQVLPKTLVHTYQKVISNKAIELIGK